MTVTKTSSDSSDLLRVPGFAATTLFLQLEGRGIDRLWIAWILMWAGTDHLDRFEGTLFSDLDGRNFCHNLLRCLDGAGRDSHIEAPGISLTHEDWAKHYDVQGTFVDIGLQGAIWGRCMVCSLVVHTRVHLEGRQRVALEGVLEEGLVVPVLNSRGLPHNVGVEVVAVEEAVDRTEGHFEENHKDCVASVDAADLAVGVEAIQLRLHHANPVCQERTRTDRCTSEVLSVSPSRR